MYDSAEPALNQDPGYEWLTTHISPGTATKLAVRIPDGHPSLTVAMAKSYNVTVTPDANHSLVLYMLPFLEAPFAQLHTDNGVLQVLPDLTLGGRAVNDPSDWMRDKRIYGYRCTLQSITVENNSSQLANGGNVVAALIPSQVDVHEMAIVGDSNGTRRYTRVIDSFPITSTEISSSVQTPYFASAREGCYMVNRNFSGDWGFRMRNTDWDKASHSAYTVSAVGALTAATVSIRNSLAYKTPAGVIHMASFDNLNDGVYNNTPATDTTVMVSGVQGTGYGVGVIRFDNLPDDATFQVKLVHGYEFILKPGSELHTLAGRAPLRAGWVFNALARQLDGKASVFPASANFVGALLSGLKWLLPAVLPLAREYLPKMVGGIARWVTGKVTPEAVAKVTEGAQKKVNDALAKRNAERNKQ